MNNIYKVIWSKAKNCYVVASEIARSHTKSASGSEKIGGVARHALLALGAACAIACGGFVNVGAYESVDVTTTGGSNAKVYTADATDSLVHDKVETGIRSELNYYYKKSDVDAKLEALTTTGDVATNKNNINDLKTKAATTDATLNDLSGRMAAAESDIDGLQADMSTAKSDIGTLKSDVSTAKSDIGTLKADMTTAKSDIGTLKADVSTAKSDIGTLKTKDTELDQKIDKEIQDRENAIKDTNDRTGGIKRNTEGTQTTIEGIVKVDNQGNVKDVKDLSAETITTKGDAVIGGDLKVTGETTLDGALTAKGEAKFTENVTVGKDLTVDGKLNVGKISMKNDELDINGDQHHSATTITADGISNNAKVTDKNGVTTESKFTHDKEGSTTYAKKGDATDWKESTSNVTADGVENVAKDSKGNNNTFTQTSTDTKNILKDNDGNTSTTRQDSKGIYGYAKDKDGNKSYTKQEGNRIAESVIGQDGKQTKSEMTSTDITNTAKDGTITNDAKDIVNNATGDMTNNVGGNLSTTVGGNEIHEVKGTKTETVEGKVTENFKNGQETNVTGNQDIHVTGKQTNTVGGGQENIISGGQTNTITGGQINNITGDQTTTITGNKTETVTENVTEDYKKNLTTTVGGNEIHEVKGTKTETVEGKVIENFKGGQETNVTGNQDIHVTGKQTNKIDGDQVNTIGGDQTTNVTGDISNKAENITNEAKTRLTDKVGENTRVLDSEGITDTVPGADGKGSTFKQRIDAIMGNVKTDAGESEVTQKGDEITSVVGKGEATNSRVTQKKGSLEAAVTDGINTNVSYDVANASAKELTDGTKVNKLQDNLDSSEKTITNGTYKTSKLQTALDITNTAKDGTITNDAKNIVNNAQDTITNTAGTKITDTAGDSTVTTENGKGTTFTKTGSTAYREGGPTDTNISGNTITTGKVTMDYADVMRDLGVGGNATITGDVTAKSYKVGDKTYISADGINANNQKITNVADGSISEGSKDAVNGGQLYGVKRDLEHQVDKVGANAAAMANLRPMEFDPSSKWNIAAAIGNYGSETAAALGAFYRPNDNVMVNLSTAFGTGENMVGGGVSVRLGKGGNKLSREETNALKAQVADLSARMDALLSVLNPNMSKDFPDVPENHWAYEAVSRLAGNDIVQGYPDGEFHGERTMTRYEMAEIIYNALSRGAEAERELVEEFKPELQAMAASEKSTAEKAEG